MRSVPQMRAFSKYKRDLTPAPSAPVGSPKEYMEFLKSLAAQKNWKTCLEVVDSMRAKHITPDVWVYNTVLHSCVQARVPDVAAQVWEDMKNHNVMPDMVSYNTCMSAYDRGGQPRRALELFDQMEKPDNIALNVAMSACGKLNEWQRALELFASIEPNNVKTASCVTALNALNSDWQRALRLYDSFSPAVKSTEEVRSTLITILSRHQQLSRALDMCDGSTRGYNAILRGGVSWSQALDVMSRIRKPDVSSYNSTLRALRLDKEWQRALQILESLTRRSSSSSGAIKPNVVTYNEVLQALEQANKPRLARAVLQKMDDDKCTPNVISYQSVLVASGRQNDGWEAACRIFDEMKLRRCMPDSRIYTSLLRILGEGGMWKRALDLIATQEATTPMVNACISALGSNSQEDALRLMKRVKPDVMTYTSAIGACTEWSVALKLFNAMRTEGIAPTIKTASAIVRALARDEPGIALRIFTKIPPADRDVTLLNTALLALNTLGAWSHAVELAISSPNADAVTYRTCIDLCERHEQYLAAEDMYQRMKAFVPILKAPKLDLHGYTAGMACAAVRHFLRTESPCDLILVTGEGKHSNEKPVLEDALMAMTRKMQISLEKGSFVVENGTVVRQHNILGRLKCGKEEWVRWIESGQKIL